MCCKRIRGARWQGLGHVSSVKQFNPYTDPERRQTDGQTDDSMMPIATYTVYQ